jgi:hypothetical protein
MLRIALAVLALLALPAPALAFEGFVGVQENGALVRFSSQEPFSWTTPVRPRGLLPGERIVALGTGPHGRGLVGIGSSARLYAFGRVTGRARPIGPPFPEGLRGSRFSLAIAPSEERGRLISDVGQDLFINLSTGQTEPGPGLRRADNGEPLRPAVDAAPGGALVGVQLRPTTLFRETAPGASTMMAIPVQKKERDPTVNEPIGFQLGSDRIGYMLGVLGDRQRNRQSVLLPIDPATGNQVPESRRPGYLFLPRRLTAFASLGPVRTDRTPPVVRARLASRVSVRGLLNRHLPLRVACSEACQISVQVRSGIGRVGWAYGFRHTPGVIDIDFSARAEDRQRLRDSVGRRVRLKLSVNDLKSNRRSLTLTARLVR